MNSKVYDEWLKINVEMHNKLEELKKLDKERNELIKENETKQLTEEVIEKLNKSIECYENLLKEVELLKVRAQKLKEEIE